VTRDSGETPARRTRKRKQTRPQRRSFRTWLNELSTTVKAVGAVAGAIAAIVGLVFLIFPDLRPDPTPDEGSATFSKPTLEQPVTFGQYLDRVEIPREGYTTEALQRRGALVSVQVTIKGYRNQALPLRWYLLDGAEIVDQQSRRHTLTADRNDAPAAWTFWAAIPPGTGPFKIRLQIYPPEAKPGVIPLHEEETESFVAAAA
jgi:hypothetical protein